MIVFESEICRGNLELSFFQIFGKTTENEVKTKRQEGKEGKEGAKNSVKKERSRTSLAR